jgi:teichuronic acid biosynthesis glycosyltransferase TuaG
VPGEITYKKLLKQNIISNSSVLVRKESYIKYSPDLNNSNDLAEDFACWLNMLRSGLTASGIDEPLIIYRVTKGSRSGNKFTAARLNMNTYKCIGLGFFARLYYQFCYAVNGIKKYSHIRRRG